MSRKYVGPYLELEVDTRRLRGSPYPSAEVATKFTAVVRLRPKITEVDRGVVRQHVIVFVPKKWFVGESAVSEDNVFAVVPGPSENQLFKEYRKETEELEDHFETCVISKYGFVELEN